MSEYKKSTIRYERSKKSLLALNLLLVICYLLIVSCPNPLMEPLLAPFEKDKPFDPPTYTVTVNGGSGGGYYAEGVTVGITATPPDRERFTRWSTSDAALLDENSFSTSFVMPAKAVTVTAHFEPIPADAKAIITFIFPGLVEGTIDENAKTISITVPYGTDVTALTPAVEYDGESYAPTGAQDFSSPVTYTVTAADGSTVQYTVTVTVAPPNTFLVTVNNGTSDNASGYYAQGATVTITADTPPQYNKFSHWTATGVTLPNPNITPTTFTMPSGAVEVTAHFAALVETKIEAAYSNSSDPVYANTPLDNLKDWLAVTLTYEDNSTRPLTADEYDLTGTLTAGSTCTITVNYKSLTTTFNVVVAAMINAQPPNITTHPANTNFTINTPITLTVTATSPDGGTLTYQWYSNTSASNSGGTVISGANNDAYSPPVNAAGTFYYYVVVTNTITDNGDGGTKTAITASNVAAVSSNVLINAQPPNITIHPANTNFTINTPITLSVTATSPDGGNLSYQWYSNTSASNSGGSAISGANNDAYNPPVNAAGTFYYYVVVTNTITDNGDGGTKTAITASNVAAVSSNAMINAQPPSITTQPSGGTYSTAQTVTLSVAASSPDGGTLTYQWYSNTSASNSGGTAIGGATTASYNLGTLAAGTYYYYCVVTNTITDNGDDGTKTAITASNVAAITVIQEVTNITGVPAAMTAGTPLTLTGTVVPSNATNQTIVWSVNNAGGTGASITGSTLNATAAGTVTVTAAIANGLVSGAYTQNFNITVQQSATFTITLADIIDAAETISIPGLTVSQSLNETSPVNITITAPGVSNIKWKVNGNEIGNTATLSVSMANLNSAGIYYTGNYFLMLEVSVSGVPYNKTVAFTVVE